jgi:hypothetical protein
MQMSASGKETGVDWLMKLECQVELENFDYGLRPPPDSLTLTAEDNVMPPKMGINKRNEYRCGMGKVG